MSVTMIMILLAVVAALLALFCVYRRDFPVAAILAVVAVLLFVFSGASAP